MQNRTASLVGVGRTGFRRKFCDIWIELYGLPSPYVLGRSVDFEHQMLGAKNIYRKVGAWRQFSRNYLLHTRKRQTRAPVLSGGPGAAPGSVASKNG